MLCTALYKIFLDEAPSGFQSALRGERCAFQIAGSIDVDITEEKCRTSLSVEVQSEISSNIRIFTVEHAPSMLPAYPLFANKFFSVHFRICVHYSFWNPKWAKSRLCFG